MRRSWAFAAVLASVLLAACSRSEKPAPVYDGVSGAKQSVGGAPVSQAGITETAGGRITVQQGETLYAIAHRSGVPVRALIDANGLEPPYRVKAGQVLTLPRTRQYVVQQGDTLYAIARRYGVEASSLARLNHLEPPFLIKLGQALLMPSLPAESAPAATPSPAPTPQESGSGASGVTTTVLPPPTVPSVAPPPPPTPTPPTPQPAPPPAPSPAPPPAPVPVSKPPASEPEPKPVPAEPAASPPAPESRAVTPVTAPVVAPVVVAPVVAAQAVAALVEAHRAPTAPLFGWPVGGRVISTFGPAAGGTHNDGINIAAPEGSTVVAAESGTVAYAGNELRGFGNLLLVKHDGGWVTAYAHNAVLLVKKGDHVRRGQAIARVGNTGGVGDAQLHFELRSGTKAVDPLDHLPQLTTGN